MKQTLRLPEKLSYGAVGGSQFSTDIITSSSGFEQRIINWSYPRAKYNLLQALETKEDIDELIKFFNIHKGRGHSFRFKDFCDFSVTKQKIGVGDGKTSSYQLIKTYSLDQLSVDRKINKPVFNSLNIFLNNKKTDFECDYEKGLITLKEVPELGEIITASFEFDVEVRFDMDHLEVSPDPLHNYKDISLIEVI